MLRTLLAALLCLLPSLSLAADRPERWGGEIELGAAGGGMKMTFEVTLAPPSAPNAAWTGTLSLPMQGLKNAPLRDVAFDPATREMKFTLGLDNMPEARWAHFTLTRDAAADPPGALGPTAAGHMAQAGMKAKVTMRVLAEGETAGPNRPQTPRPPFPYAARDVTYTNTLPGAGGGTLAGTLTIPERGRFGPGPHPAVILISGSGPQDRDATLAGHKLFAVLADALTRAGVAVLRVDDRGIGGSTAPKHGQETSDDFVTDVRAGLAFLRAQPEIDASRLGLIGHSEGGIIAPMVAVAEAPPEKPAAEEQSAASPRAGVRFIVLLAPPAVPGSEVMKEQMIALLRAARVPEEAVAAQSAAQTALIDAIATGGGHAEVQAAVTRLVRLQMGLGPDDEPPEAMREQFDQLVNLSTAQMMLPWMKRFLTLDPRAHLRRLPPDLAVLALFGGKDLQVLPSQNEGEMRSALEAARVSDAAVETFPDVNHLLQPCGKGRTGAATEYERIEETIDPKALARIVEWVAKRGKQ
ncbi:MAG: alpha/beta hydrolase family protein [Phycisphaerales bacterium]